MKKKEKLVILVLLIITIALIVVGVVTKNNKNNETKISDGGNSQTSDNANEKIPSADEENISVLEDGTRFNTSDILHKEKTVDGIKFSDIQLVEKGNVSELLATATNNSQETKGGYLVKVTFVDKDNKEIYSINGNIQELQPGESTQFLTNATFDLAGAYDFRIEKQ